MCASVLLTQQQRCDTMEEFNAGSKAESECQNVVSLAQITKN